MVIGYQEIPMLSALMSAVPAKWRTAILPISSSHLHV